MQNNRTVVLSVVLLVLLFGLCFFLKVYDISARQDDDTNSLITVPSIITAPAGTHIRRMHFISFIMSSS